jgi:hypothetical protein
MTRDRYSFLLLVGLSACGPSAPPARPAVRVSVSLVEQRY